MQTDYSQITKHIVEFQKMSFANWYNAVTMVQDHTRSTMDAIVSQNAWIPEQGRNALQTWISACHQEHARLKNFVDEGFSNVEKFLGQDNKPAPSKATRQKS